jgi:hypothetical protein
LKELIAYDGEINTDRVVAFMLCILQTKELHKLHIDNMVGRSNNIGNDPFLKKMWELRNIPKNNFNFRING